ncbi:hypothetical protein PsorP6_016015 [Peronosclerospora sorghi]|uniref:Uncharacterized protein n=1 Tax=Peronosclerospora sorghi TaxID=230839 RepID=A0ACC0WNK9_9STRA|nr:hypothetical protein PsorP6_016015 [Peronosclerospora sorghi]
MMVYQGSKCRSNAATNKRNEFHKYQAAIASTPRTSPHVALPSACLSNGQPLTGLVCSTALLVFLSMDILKGSILSAHAGSTQLSLQEIATLRKFCLARESHCLTDGKASGRLHEPRNKETHLVTSHSIDSYLLAATFAVVAAAAVVVAGASCSKLRQSRPRAVVVAAVAGVAAVVSAAVFVAAGDEHAVETAHSGSILLAVGQSDCLRAGNQAHWR